KSKGEYMSNYKVFIAELIGTFALVFIGAAAGMYNAGLLTVALAHGLTLAVFAYAFGHISGTHINPAVTFGLALNGTVKWGQALVYWVAQFAGAVLAAYALSATVGVVSAQAFQAAQTVGALTEKFPYYALGVEALLTFFLVNTVLHTAVAGKAGPLAGWAIGTTLAIAILAGDPLTGASLNPARTFGPAVVAGAAGNEMMYLIYFVGPLLGAVLAVGVYKLLNTPEKAPELEPIPDVAEAPVNEEPVVVRKQVARRKTPRRATKKK
ncbi:MAG TPA: aquaporin, partial [Anaerolineales bacterium]|nr:aquaporin [Anaerolineales bacterium]